VFALNHDEEELAKAGLKIDAIKAYRARILSATGALPGLKEAKDTVEAYMAAVAKPPFNPLNPPPLTEMHKSMVIGGLKVDAIKAYREYTAQVCGSMAGIKESLDIVNVYAASLSYADVPPPLDGNEASWLYLDGSQVSGRLNAIKAYRERTGLGLAAGKKAVDNYIDHKWGPTYVFSFGAVV